MIKVRDLYKSFDGHQVLKNFNLEINAGEIFVVLGESGSGKSVFLRHLIGLEKPDRGTITIEGTDITQLSERELLSVRKRIGYLFQEGALYDFMTVYENVAFPLKEHTQEKAGDIQKKVMRILDLVGLAGAAKKFPSELSGGMKKSAALARSVILDSKILFCDEPTSGLDPIKSWNITNLIQHIARELHCTMVVTSHDMLNSFRIADRIVLVREGEIAATGTPQELESSNDKFVQDFLRYRG